MLKHVKSYQRLDKTSGQNRWTSSVDRFIIGRVSIYNLGLDIALHQEPAYPVEAYGHGHIEKIIQILEYTPAQVIQGKLGHSKGIESFQF